MNLSITARHVEISDSIKNYLKKRLNKLEKYFNKKEVNVHITFMAEKSRQGIEVAINYNGENLHGKETTESMLISIDKVIEKLEHQLKKSKEKTQKKPRVSLKTIQEIPLQDKKIIHRKKLLPKPITLEEAIIQLEQTSLNFLVFVESQTETINVLYRCKNGNYGLIEP